MKKLILLSILLIVVGFSQENVHKINYDYEDGTVLDCVNIEYGYEIGVSFWQPISRHYNCFVAEETFDPNKIPKEMLIWVNPEENGTRKVMVINLNNIKNIVYKNGEIITNDEIQSSYKKWTIGVNVVVFGVTASFINIIK